MFKNLSLGLKIAGGFSVIIFITLCFGTYSYFSLHHVEKELDTLNDDYIPLAAKATHSEELLESTILQIRSYTFTEDKKHLKKSKTFYEKFVHELDGLISKTNNIKELKKINKDFKSAKEQILEYNALVEQSEKYQANVDAARIKMNVAYNNLKAAFEKLVEHKREYVEKLKNKRIPYKTVENIYEFMAITTEVSADIRQLYLNVALARLTKNFMLMEESFALFDEMKEDFIILKEVSNLTDRSYLEKTESDLVTFRESMERVYENEKLKHRASEKSYEHSLIALQSLKDVSDKAADSSSSLVERIYDEVEQNLGLIMIGSLIALGAGALIAYLMTKGITRPISLIAGKLEESSQTVSSTSVQISSSSQQLAAGSAEQALSIEETSSTLEESASMVKQNTENTQQAAGLARQTKMSAVKGNDEMNNMMSSMLEIKKSSDEIGKIIKVIDDIAFQTNILALNAAVEAARAGESGMGFAVVAEEVRNLAQRSAQAAKDTSGIIEANINLSEKGVHVAGKVNESLSEINDQAQKVSDLLDEVSTASQEQAQGISQINNAISQMEQIVQSNAASADQSASASESMSEQAVKMQNIVKDLMVLVNGANISIQQSSLAITSQSSNMQQKPAETKKQVVIADKKNTTIPKEQANKAKASIKKSDTKVVSPEDVIPLEDNTEGF